MLCKEIRMPSNLAIDDKLLAEAQRAGGHRTKKETVTAALTEYVAKRKQRRILSLFGTIDFDPDYDYKRERLRRK
jgi:Arc/MetJ family transcription regulator